METQSVNSTDKLSAIELALAAAKARKAAKEQSAGQPSGDTQDRASARAQIEADRAARKARREEEGRNPSPSKEEKRALKAAKRAAKDAEHSGRPVHMKKVERAKSRLPSLCSNGERILTTALTDLNPVQLESLAQHLVVSARERRTLNAINASRIPVGSAVRIVGGDPKFIGSTGTIVSSHKLRLLVSVEGSNKPLYIYSGEAEPV